MSLSRRCVLTSLGVAVTISGSGCLSENIPSEPTSTADAAYETCTASHVLYESLPDEVASEVDTALNDGAYETSGPVFYDLAVGDETPLAKGETFYFHRVEQTNGRSILTFEEWTAYDSPVELTVQNGTTEPRTVSVLITDKTGNTALSAEFRVEPTESQTRQITKKFGEYEVSVTADTDRQATSTWPIGPSAQDQYWGGAVILSEDGVEFDRMAEVYDKPVCPWE